MTDEPCDGPSKHPSRIQREAIRILAETMQRGCVELSFLEGELSKLDEFTERGVREQLSLIFDTFVELPSGESLEPIPGLTLTRIVGLPARDPPTAAPITGSSS